MSRPDSGRYDGDTWDLASGVGATATAVATSRALATRTGLIDDRLAEPLVKAVGMEMYLDILNNPVADPGQVQMAEGMAIRTRYFDEFVLGATAAGIRQIVILASGLDARPYRLGWPAETVVFELDQPQVLAFKNSTMNDLGVQPIATLHSIPIDLRQDWPQALLDNGFQRGRQTAWLAEGLLMYLPPDAQDRLFDHITDLSPAGSRLCTEFVPDMSAFGLEPGNGAGASAAGEAEAEAEAEETSEDRWRRLGFKDDLAALVYPGERSHVIEYLTAQHWTVTSSLVRDLVAAQGFQDHEMSSKFENFQYLSATLNEVV